MEGKGKSFIARELCGTSYEHKTTGGKTIKRWKKLVLRKRAGMQNPHLGPQLDEVMRRFLKSRKREYTLEFHEQLLQPPVKQRTKQHHSTHAHPIPGPLLQACGSRCQRPSTYLQRLVQTSLLQKWKFSAARGPTANNIHVCQPQLTIPSHIPITRHHSPLQRNFRDQERESGQPASQSVTSCCDRAWNLMVRQNATRG